MHKMYRFPYLYVLLITPLILSAKDSVVYDKDYFIFGKVVFQCGLIVLSIGSLIPLVYIFIGYNYMHSVLALLLTIISFILCGLTLTSNITIIISGLLVSFVLLLLAVILDDYVKDPEVELFTYYRAKCVDETLGESTILPILSTIFTVRFIILTCTPDNDYIIRAIIAGIFLSIIAIIWNSVVFYRCKHRMLIFIYTIILPLVCLLNNLIMKNESSMVNMIGFVMINLFWITIGIIRIPTLRSSGHSVAVPKIPHTIQEEADVEMVQQNQEV